MSRRGYRRWFIPLLLILGIVLASPLTVQAAKNSGRAYQYMLGHANGDDLDTMLHIELGDTRKGIINPQFRLLKGIDGYSVSSLFTEDEFIDKYNKDFVKEKKGYRLEAIAADRTIVEIKNLKSGGYTAKGLKEGQTVIRFYETYLGDRRYLGCRLANVGAGDTTMETVTLFVGSRIRIPSTWYSTENYSDGFDGTDTNPIPSNKSLFKKVKVSKEFSYYQAAKTGETTATIRILNAKKTFRVRIVEPSIKNRIKKEYNFYEGYSIRLWDSIRFFDSYSEYEFLEATSSDSDIIEIKGIKDDLQLVTKKTGSAIIKLYYKMNKESKYLGEFTVNVLQNNDPAYLNRFVEQPLLDNEADPEDSDPVPEQKKPTKSGNEATGPTIVITGETRISGEDQLEYTADRSNVVWSVSDNNMALLEEVDGILILYPIRTGTFTLYADTDTAHGELSITNEEIRFDEE